MGRAQAVGPARRLLASFVDWAATFALVIAASSTQVGFGRALLVVPTGMFLLAAGAGAGPGELLARTRVVDAASGAHLRIDRVLVRVVVQLVSSYAIGLTGWLSGILVAALIGGLSGGVGVGTILLGVIIGTPTALVLAEPFFVRVTDSRTTPWDFAARSAVVSAA